MGLLSLPPPHLWCVRYIQEDERDEKLVECDRGSEGVN